MTLPFIKDTDKQDLKDEYQTAITNLTQIRDAPTMTQTEAIQAIQYMAKVLLLLMRFISKYIE